MKIAKVTRVEAEARRFLVALDGLRAEHEAQRKAKEADPKGRHGTYYSPEDIWAPRVTGALKRASMDLTRSLADMRKPG